MIFYGKKLTQKFAIDIACFYNHRSFEDGISFVEFDISWDKYLSDHKPSFQIRFALFNFTILDFTIYNVNHVEQYTQEEYEAMREITVPSVKEKLNQMFIPIYGPEGGISEYEFIPEPEHVIDLCMDYEFELANKKI